MVIGMAIISQETKKITKVAIFTLNTNFTAQFYWQEKYSKYAKRRKKNERAEGIFFTTSFVIQDSQPH